MNYFHAFSYIVLSFYFCFAAGEQSHYEAALELMETVHEIDGSDFIDTIIAKIIDKEPDLEKHKDDISSLIQTYLHSPDYRETRIKAIMYFFTEMEIRNINNKLKNPSFYNLKKEQTALFEKYQKIFSGLEEKFIEYIQKKLRRKY